MSLLRYIVFIAFSNIVPDQQMSIVAGMRKVLGRFQQVELAFPVKRGGYRRGSGRKPKGKRAGVPHRRRPKVTRHDPVHITLRVLDDVDRLRKREAYQAIRAAMFRVHRRADFRIIHVSIQHNHVHLICEASDRIALSRGVSALKISAARQLNRKRGRTGRVFSERYHAEIITCPRQARHALSYVLNNWRHHHEDRTVHWKLDPYSSAISFRHWAEAPKGFAPPPGYEPLPVHEPRTYLLDVWRKNYALISCYEVPGSRS